VDTFKELQFCILNEIFDRMLLSSTNGGIKPAGPAGTGPVAALGDANVLGHIVGLHSVRLQLRHFRGRNYRIGIQDVQRYRVGPLAGAQWSPSLAEAVTCMFSMSTLVLIKLLGNFFLTIKDGPAQKGPKFFRVGSGAIYLTDCPQSVLGAHARLLVLEVQPDRYRAHLIVARVIWASCC
jgi:hypothetical protein